MDSLGFSSIEFFFLCCWILCIVSCLSPFVFLTTSALHHEGRISWFSWVSLLGGKYTKKLIIVLDAGTKPEEKHELTETELFLLFHEKPLGPIDEAETPKMLYDLKSIVDKESKITEVEIHQSSMHSATDTTKAFHVFNVFRTTSESDGDYWWSLEKNLECLVLQRSRNKDDVRKKLYGKERKKVKSIVENLGGKGSIKDLFGMLLSHKVIREIYNITESNCESLVTFVSKQITEIKYKYDGWECSNQMRVENLHILTMYTGVTEWPPLFIFVYSENTDLVDKMIESGKYDINALHGGMTPLQFAIRLHKTNMVKHLLKDPINADPTTRDSEFGWNALQVAVTHTLKKKIIDLLLAHPKVKVDDVDGDGQTALHLAANLSNVKAVQKLLDKGANPNVRDKLGRSPLHLAALYGTKKIIDLILQAQKHNHVDDDKAQNGATALHCAAASSNEIIAQHLMNKGADLHSRDKNGLTPLHEAALKAKDLRIIDFFLRKTKDTDMLYQYRNDVQLLYNAYRNKNLLGAKIAARINRMGNPLSWANKILHHVIEIPAKLLLEHNKEVTNFSSRLKKLNHVRITYAKNDQEIDEILKERKFDINNRDRRNGDTPLLVAIDANNVIAVRRLLERGADPTLRDKNGFTPIQVAATRKKDFKILDLLLANDKVDINDGGQSGYTVLHWAVATSDVTTVRFLLSKGANPNVADQNGATPLHVAAYCAGTTDVLGLILINKQVDINGRDKNGQTALHFAVRGNRVDNVRYLLENGADRTIRDQNGLTPYQVAAAAVNQDSAILDLLLSNENKTEIGEGNNAEDLENVELPPSQEDVVDVNSLDNSGAQQHIQGQSEDISNPLKDATEVIGNTGSGMQISSPIEIITII
jgi:ankyrin repeat protein